MNRVWLLGAPDPEMQAIEELLKGAGETIAHMSAGGGRRVHPGNAYDITAYCGRRDHLYLVECGGEVVGENFTRIDHHRPGDTGYGMPPRRFMEASSIGQTIAELARLGKVPKGWEMSPYHLSLENGQFATLPSGPVSVETPFGPRIVPQNIVYVAAADHCLAAAYRSECPGVDPDGLLGWRVTTRSRHQGRPADEIMDDVARTREALETAPRLIMGGVAVADMRRGKPWPELVEAGTFAGIPYLAGPLGSPDGRKKYTLSGSAPAVEAFLQGEGPAADLADRYGDPARGFAGGYKDE